MMHISILDIISLVLIYYLSKEFLKEKNILGYIIFFSIVGIFFVQGFHRYETTKLRTYSKTYTMKSQKMPCDSFIFLENECEEYNSIIEDNHE